MIRKDEILDFHFEMKLEDVTPEGFFKGYASTFGGPPDSGGDIVAPGAFKNTIKRGGRNRNGIAMLWSHDPHSPIGTWPVLSEDAKGLYVEGMVEPTVTPGGIPVLKLMKMGSVRGLSIGFNTIKYEIDKKKQIRTLQEVELWEISPVTFPMNKFARITSVKNIRDARTVREFEESLREAGISREDAKWIAKWWRPNLREADAVEGEGLDSILQTLRNVDSELAMQAIQGALKDF